MKIYYLHNGLEQQGPFDIEDLKTKNIAADTPIWYDGLTEWTTAGKISELKALFVPGFSNPYKTKAASPPPFTKSNTIEIGYETVPASKNKAGKLIRIAIVVVVLAFIGNAMMNNKLTLGDSSYSEQVMSIEEIERSAPTRFLSAEGTYRENFWGNKFKVKCIIKNQATVATYKDAVIRVTYYTKTNTVIGTSDHTVYEVFPPTSSKTIELKIDNYDNVATIGWEVIKAVGY